MRGGRRGEITIANTVWDTKRRYICGRIVQGLGEICEEGRRLCLSVLEKNAMQYL